MHRRSNPATAPIPKGSAFAQFAAVTLILEAFVIGFFGLTAFGLKVVPTHILWIGCGGAALLCIIAAMAVRKNHMVGLVLGCIGQVAVLLTGVWIPLSLVVSVSFLFLWIASIYWGLKLDKERVVRREEQAQWEADHPDELS